MRDMCREHRCLTTCQKQHRQNEPAFRDNVSSVVDISGWEITDTFKDHRHPTACQKQHRQNEPVGWVDIATELEVRMIVDPRHV